MSDQSIFASCITLCGLTCFSALEPWCNTKRYGCDCCACGGQRGFCGSCFDRGFDEDAWDRHDAEQRANAVPPSVHETAPANPEEQPHSDAEKSIQTEQPEAMAEMKPINSE